MNSMKAQLKMHYMNTKKGFMIFWAIIAAITVIGMLIALYLRSEGYNGKFTVNNMPGVVLFGSVSSMVAYYETMPYALNMGRTRKNFVLSFAAYNVLLSLSLSVTLIVLSLVESSIYTLLGFSHIYIGQIILGMGITEILSKLLLTFSITLAMSALFALITSIYYKKGMMFLFGLGALIMLTMFIPGVGASAAKALEFIILSLLNKEGYAMTILYSLGFFLACYLIIYPLARVSQAKR